MGDAHVTGLVVITHRVLVAQVMSRLVGIVSAKGHVGAIAMTGVLLLGTSFYTPPTLQAAGGATWSGNIFIRVYRGGTLMPTFTVPTANSIGGHLQSIGRP